MRSKSLGFTLIELMIAVAVIGILAAVAYPAYTKHLIKGNRVSAQAAMMDLANREQQYLLNNRAYADHTTMASATGYTLPTDVSKYYTYAIATVASPPAFTITFSPISTTMQATDGDLTLDNNGTKTPSDKW